jgi:hypothetical protein
VTTIRASGVRFKLYPEDHLPRHAHGLYAGIEVIVDLAADGTVTLAKRKDAIQPKNAKRNDVRKILQTAAENFDALVDAWEAMHRNG